MILFSNSFITQCLQGTVPAEGVEKDGSTDEFAEIKLADLVPNFADEHGKVSDY